MPLRYAILPVLGTLLCNFLAYYGTRLLNAGMTHHDLSLPLDGRIPMVPAAIVVYILAYGSWVLGYWVIARESRAVCYEILAGEQIAKLLCLVCFLLLPTAMERPAVTGGGFFAELTRLIYRFDTPDNLFPSIHCLENWICFRGSLSCRKAGKGYRIGTFVFALLVFASTVLVKQHVLADVVAGVAVAEAGLYISKRVGAGRIYEALNRKWNL